MQDKQLVLATTAQPCQVQHTILACRGRLFKTRSQVVLQRLLPVCPLATAFDGTDESAGPVGSLVDRGTSARERG